MKLYYSVIMTIQMIPEKVADSMRELEELMASYNNFSAYRKALNTAKENAKGGNSGLPILPYLGVFLKDITFCMGKFTTQI